MAGESAGMGRRGSMSRVAALAGVSISTVSNVLNNPQLVAIQTRRRVEDAMVQVGYVRNGAARQLAGGVSSVVGCLFLDVANPFFADVARGAEDRLSEANCMMMLCSTDVRIAKQDHYLQMLEEQGVRGILISPVTSRLDRILDLTRRGTPAVLLDHPRAGADLCAVSVDGVQGGQLAAEHLLSLGHERLVLLRGSGDVRSVSDRRAGVDAALRKAHLDPSRVLIEIKLESRETTDAADMAIDQVIALSPRPTAIICFNDIAALGAMRGLKRRGMTVPGDMSVIGYDDLQFAAVLSPALTTIRQPRYELGSAAAELLLAEGRAGHQHQEIVFVPELVVRASTRRLDVAAP